MDVFATALKRWDQVKSAFNVTEFDDDPEELINRIKDACNSTAESTEFKLQDAYEAILTKLSNITPEEHTTLVHEMLQKLADANDKKKSHSEVFTKLDGAKIVIRKAFRRNPRPFLNMNSKFCEISFGTGNFIQAMVSVLMETLRNPLALQSKQANAMTDEELRCYILDNMIYGVELQSQFRPVALYILDREQKCKNLNKHLYTGDSLLFDYVFDGEPMMGKFDVVFGNPPYNVIDNKDKGKYKYSKEAWGSSREAGALHTYFIRLALDLLKHGGMMLYVTRASVLVGEVLSDFREQIIKTNFDVQMVYIPQGGTLFEGAQTTGMGLLCVKKDPGDTRTPTEYTRYMDGVEYSCSYTIKDTDEKIPLLWHQDTVEIWEQFSKLGNRFRTYKGISRDDVIKNGKFDIVDSITKAGPVFGKTDKSRVRVSGGVGAERTDPKVLVSSGCTDSFGTTVKWFESYFDDVTGKYSYTGNVIAIVLEGKTGADIVSILEDPVAQIYGSLFRIDRNTSAAHYRMFSYDMSQVKFKKDLIKWAKSAV